METYSMDNVKKDATFSWSNLCYKVDPELKEPVKTYVFNNGQRVFYGLSKKEKRKG